MKCSSKNLTTLFFFAKRYMIGFVLNCWCACIIHCLCGLMESILSGFNFDLLFCLNKSSWLPRKYRIVSSLFDPSSTCILSQYTYICISRFKSCFHHIRYDSIFRQTSQKGLLFWFVVSYRNISHCCFLPCPTHCF